MNSKVVGVWFLAVAGIAGCAKLETREAATAQCAPESLRTVTGSEGSANVLFPDPVAASGDPALSPGSLRLDLFDSAAPLRNLGGRGVLEGQYVEVRNGLSCGGWFGAYDEKNLFTYPYADARFQEAASYYVGDGYRSRLDELQYLAPAEPVRIIAHCDRRDNASFQFARDSAGQTYPKVCLSDSSTNEGAYYSDDAVVTIHELQHATTIDLYTGGTRAEQLTQFFYDEAGALNEGISDFMALAYTALSLSDAFDPRQFSRWALDKFLPNYRATRGAHRCPEYDSAFGARCSGFPGLSSDTNTVSYVYPDGIGWPYADNYSGSDKLRQAFLNYRSKEEIHGNGILLTGALFDLYEALKAGHGGDALVAQGLTMKAVLEALRHLPRPNASNRSPVTLRGFAATLLAWDRVPTVGFSEADHEAALRVFTERGLIGGRQLEPGWAQIGDGAVETPGLKVEDLPQTLKAWLGMPEAIPQTIETGRNNKADPGEVIALWFDLKNISEVTAGGVLLKVVSLEPELVTFLGNDINVGYVSPSETQVMYSKINGTAAALALSSGRYPIATSNTYFKTVPEYRNAPVTPVWVKVASSAPHGKQVLLRVEALPANGEASVVEFPLTIN
ncbi:MAG: hypothetical protein NDJ90_08065 [Oligoflexia bacterium]|nr:hypothetical protein [Oligoflexia bacterium]